MVQYAASESEAVFVISVFTMARTVFTGNGDAVLCPTECTITEDAGGNYELSMTHPIDDDGKWEFLQTGAIIKAPIPTKRIANAWSGIDADIYVTNGTTNMRSGPSEPTRITYPTWSQYNHYSVGSKVTSGGNNYQCVYWDSDDLGRGTSPAGSSWWTRIANGTSGSPIIMSLPGGTELLFRSDNGDGWYYMMTWQGVEGYVKASDLSYSRHQSAELLPDRVVTDQLFRIYKTQIASTKAQTITVNAKHVSYDMAGVIMRTCNIVRATPAMAISMMINSLMMGTHGSISTNLTSEENGNYSGDLTGKNLIYGILDPDKGMVHYFAAQFQRDNWDVFIMKNDITDYGVRLNYGKNLRGVTWTRNIDKVVTRIVPVAKAEDGSDLYLPEIWIDSPYINNYPTVKMEQLRVNGQVGRDDGTETGTSWTEETLFAEMRTEANERYSVDHVDGIVTEVDVDFTQLSQTAEYSQFLGLEGIDMYNRITVLHPDIGLSQQLQVSRIEWDAIMKRYRKIKLGNVFDYGGRTTTGYSVGPEAIYYEKITQGTVDQIRQESVEDAQPRIDTAKTEAISTAVSRAVPRAQDSTLRWLSDHGYIDY